MFNTLEEIMGEDSKAKLNMHLMNFYQSRKEVENILGKMLESVQDQDEELIEEVEQELNKIREVMEGSEEVFIGEEGKHMFYPDFKTKKQLEGIDKLVNQVDNNDVS